MKNPLFIIACMLLMACNAPQPVDSTIETGELETKKHFSIKDSAGFRIVEIFEPFVNSSITERYVLYPSANGKPQGVKADVFIGLPIDKVGINSTTHLGYLNALGKQDKIVAVSNSDLFYDSSFQQRIAAGKVTELGNRSLNKELVIKSELDVLFTFAIDASSYESVKQLRKLGQPVILIAEYMESDPIAKAEWLSVFAAFFEEGTMQKAEAHLSRVENSYNSIRTQSMLYSFLPKVTIGLPWKGTWYVSGDESYQAQLIRDAGATYCWNSYKQTASVPLDIETAISGGMQAHFWINTGTLTTAVQLQETNEIFPQFQSFQNKHIYTNYKRSNEFGANDYWEMGVVRPDLILGDLVTIFHDNKNDSLTFYKSIFE